MIGAPVSDPARFKPDNRRAGSETGAPTPVHPRNKREYLRDLVAAKYKAFRPLTEEERALGFLGWHQRGYLPHCDYPWLTQFVTFRLADSMPATRRTEWDHFLKIEDVRDRRTKLEEYLDRGVGECRLRNLGIARLAEETLLHFHNDRYELLAWCVMPNHIHALVHVWQTPLGQMIQSWKRFIATNAEAAQTERRSPTRRVSNEPINTPARRAVLQWEREYWDTFMRDEEQEKKAVRYIENNPVKANLCRVPEQWEFSSARFRDGYRRLVLPRMPNPTR